MAQVVLSCVNGQLAYNDWRLQGVMRSRGLPRFTDLSWSSILLLIAAAISALFWSSESSIFVVCCRSMEYRKSPSLAKTSSHSLLSTLGLPNPGFLRPRISEIWFPHLSAIIGRRPRSLAGVESRTADTMVAKSCCGQNPAEASNFAAARSFNPGMLSLSAVA